MRLTLALLAAAALSGCGGFQIPEPAPGQVVFLTQSRALEVVLERSKELQPGMRKQDVLGLLGRPAFMDAQGWDYVSHDIYGTPVFGPKCWKLRVTFGGDRFLASDLQPAPLSTQGQR